MDFTISPELDDLRRRIAAFVETQIIPRETDPASWDAHENIAEPALSELRAKARAAGLWCLQLRSETGGLGVVLLNSNAETHFSFTNALGFMPREQEAALAALLDADPDGIYLVALHHHVVEYPKPAKALSERIGTALVNGSWFVRRLSRFADRVVVMHGHRHIDWIGRCGPLVIISAPSPVMNAKDTGTTAFYVHVIGRTAAGRIALHAPRRIEIEGDAQADA